MAQLSELHNQHPCVFYMSSEMQGSSASAPMLQDESVVYSKVTDTETGSMLYSFLMCLQHNMI